MTRSELLKQVIAKIADRFNVNEQDIDTDSRLFDQLNFIHVTDLYLFRDQLEEELGIIPIDENQVKFWRTIEDIINSYKTEPDVTITTESGPVPV